MQLTGGKKVENLTNICAGVIASAYHSPAFLQKSDHRHGQHGRIPAHVDERSANGQATKRLPVVGTVRYVIDHSVGTLREKLRHRSRQCFGFCPSFADTVGSHDVRLDVREASERFQPLSASSNKNQARNPEMPSQSDRGDAHRTARREYYDGCRRRKIGNFQRAKRISEIVELCTHIEVDVVGQSVHLRLRYPHIFGKTAVAITLVAAYRLRPEGNKADHRRMVAHLFSIGDTINASSAGHRRMQPYAITNLESRDCRADRCHRSGGLVPEKSSAGD